MGNIIIRLRTCSAAAIAFSILPNFASAQDTYQFDESVPEPREILKILGVLMDEDDLDDVLSTRGVRYKNEQTAQSTEAKAATKPMAAESHSLENSASESNILSVPIRFAINSAVIPHQYRQHLNAIGEALNAPEANGVRLAITGHTDTSGSAEYNETLSMKRSQAVVQYLVQARGVDRSRLFADGVGETSPLPGVLPTDARNRRVDFRAL